MASSRRSPHTPLTRKIRVLLLEDNRLLREGIAATLSRRGDFKVVDPPAGRGTLLAHVWPAKPDVILMDMGILNQREIRTVAKLTRNHPEIKVIGLGLLPSQEDVLEFVEAGASAFVLKDSSVEEFLSTVRTVAHGGHVLPPVLAHSLFSQMVDCAISHDRRLARRAVRMTGREREIIALIADGLSNKEIARKLGIATYTVKSHVHNIMEKLALHSRLQIAEHSSAEKAFQDQQV